MARSRKLRAVVGLGSNLGDRKATLMAALDCLTRAHAVRRVSSLYETEPVGGPVQGPFLNAAALVETTTLEALFETTRAIELAFGRTREVVWGPRTLDLDLLWADVAITTTDLVVPHPRVFERAFAAVPLMELVPELSARFKGEHALHKLESSWWPRASRSD